MTLLGVILLIATATSFAGVCGDVNGISPVNIQDITYLINYLYKGGPAPNCPDIPPILTTADVSEITDKTARCGGNITSDGGESVDFRGVCWSTGSTPTIEDYRTLDGEGEGSFISYITGLSTNTHYYARAYATNGAGTGCGSIISFTTTDSMGTVTDINGNDYRTVKIGDQWWLAENLKATKYRNGEAIPNVTDGNAWKGLTTGAHCCYNNDMNNVATYGCLYNWYAVNDSRNIAPEGWHVPTDAEWQTLVDYLGGNLAASGKMKEVGTTHWISPNTNATNVSGFSGLPGGYRCTTGDGFGFMCYAAYFWSSMECPNPSYAWYRYLDYLQPEVYRLFTDRHFGFSIRCVKD